MRVSLRSFWTPKRGNSNEEYEDAFWPPDSFDRDSKLLRFAVADGATETSFAGSWARILTRAYCRDQLSEKKIRKQLPYLEQAWHSSIEKGQLPWYAEEKLSHGAFATVLGLTVSDGAWQAAAIGDSCLFQIRDSRVVTAFPIGCSRDFGNRPHLLSSKSCNWQDELAFVSRTQGTWQHSDVFYMMTDAMACWFLRTIEDGQHPMDVLGHAENFENWIESMRDDGMRNDDVTILTISVH